MLFTATAIVGAIFIKDLPAARTDPRAEYGQIALYACAVFGAFALLRLCIQLIRGGTALRVDQSGITTNELAMRKKASERGRKFTPWHSIDSVVVQHERTAPAGGDSFLCLYKNGPDGQTLVHRSKKTGWALDLDKLSEVTRHHAPNVEVVQRYVRDRD